MNAIIPQQIVPRVSINVRLATMDDLPFIDALQKQHTKQLGFFPRAQMEGYLKNEWVLIAEQKTTADDADDADSEINKSAKSAQSAVPLGYVASRDRYLKRDELGIIYQLCVSSGVQRKLIGAALVKAVFERSAYGCRLYCCWCAQDLEANHFWESLGFVPVAFRAGSSKKARVHIFWQKRIVDGDVETKWWYPSQTNQGAIREDRLVFPIPPGTHWKEVEAVAVPAETKLIEDRASTRKRDAKFEKGPLKPTNAGLQFGRPGVQPIVAPIVPETEEKPKREKKPKQKVDPKLVRASRELRDRYLEKINESPVLMSAAKYSVARQIAATPIERIALPDAA